jgi:hypothetical protein
VARRESYQSVIDKSRDEALPAAERPGSGQPTHARKSYPRKRALNRQLARHYEQCKRETAGRFRSERRQKQYCSAVAWKRAEQSGDFSDYPTFSRQSRPAGATETDSMRRMPRRNRKGQFVKGGEARRRAKGRGRAKAGEARRRPRARAAAYESPRRSRPRRARAASPRRAAPRRRAGRGRGRSQTNIAIVPVGVAKESRRGRGGAHRYRRAREPMMVGAGGVAMFTAGAILGDLIADVVDRYIAGYDPAASPAPTLPAPYTVDNPIPKWNNDSAAMQPGVWRILAQLGGAIIFFGLGAMVSKSMALKFFLYGIGGGFTIHVSTQIVTAYIIVPMVKGSTSTGARLYQHEINVYQGLANPSGGILGLGPGNKPARRGLLGAPPVNTPAAAPPALPANQPARMPVALAAQPSPAPVERPAQQQPQQAPAMLQREAPAPQQQQQTAAPPAQQAPANNGQAQAHPLWTVLLDRQAA